MFRVNSERSWSRKEKLQKIHGAVIGTLEERGMRSFRKREDFLQSQSITSQSLKKMSRFIVFPVMESDKVHCIVFLIRRRL
jgi:hypothetical protein